MSESNRREPSGNRRVQDAAPCCILMHWMAAPTVRRFRRSDLLSF